MRRLAVTHVGLGLWGRSWAEIVASQPGFALASVVDADAAARAWAAETFPVPVFRNLAAALRAVPSDVVVLASPPATHRALAELALAAGRHVVVEKPLAAGLEDARAISAAAAAAGRHAVVAQNYRFRRQSRALQQLVGARRLGRLLGVTIACRRDLRRAHISRRDWRGRMPHPYLLDMAIHHVDMLRMITGREIAVVDARSWRAPDGPFRYDPSVSALLELDDGTPVAYAGTWATEETQTSWNGDWELVGERARASWSGGVEDALRGSVAVSPHGGRPARVALPRLTAIDRPGVLHELRRALAAGERPETDADDNLRSLATVLALARSAEERRPVRVAEMLGA